MSKSSRHLRLHYSVGNPGFWWCPRLYKWITLEDESAKGCNKSSSRSFHTKTKAFAHCRTLGPEATVAQFNPHCGWRRKLGRGTWQIKEWKNSPWVDDDTQTASVAPVGESPELSRPD